MSFPLALQPTATTQTPSKSLQYLISRINDERGAFRNVTEETLREEIEKEEAHLDDHEDKAPNDATSTQDSEARRKEVYTARNEMLKLIGQAQNEALTALDFVSLLITKENPRAEASMSPFLKSSVPLGTLDFDRTDASGMTKAQEEKTKAVSRGWNITSLNSAADRLLNAAQRLEKEMEKETKYWEQVLSVSEKGWSTCRMPRERHTVGVRFGFSEAGPLFSARGLAALRPDSNGDIMLDQGLSSSSRVLQIRIVQDGVTTQTSQLPRLQGMDAELETVIHQARDSLFDEELFHELTREARTLTSWGVVVGNDSIYLPSSCSPASSYDVPERNNREVVIELLPSRVRSQTASEGHQLGDNIALGLRILLSNVYNQRFSKRSQPPEPISDEKRTPPIYHILRPVMTYLRHSEASSSLMNQLHSIRRTITAAGMSISAPRITHNLALEAIVKSGSPRTSIVEALKTPLKSTLNFEFPAAARHDVVITSNLSMPDYGILFYLTLLPTSSLKQETHSRTFRSMIDLRREIVSLAQQAIARCVNQDIPAWVLEYNSDILVSNSRGPGSHTKQVSLVVQDGKLALVNIEQDTSPQTMMIWDPERSGGSPGIIEVMRNALI